MRRIVIPTVCVVAVVTVVTALFVLSTGRHSIQRAEGVTLMAARTAPDLVMQAIISGTLITTDAGCLALDGGGTTYPVQFPVGTRLAEDGRTVHVPGLAPLHLGDDVVGGGGYTDLGGTPQECESTDRYRQYAVWQTILD